MQCKHASDGTCRFGQKVGCILDGEEAFDNNEHGCFEPED
jgi:hypothetical protein